MAAARVIRTGDRVLAALRRGPLTVEQLATLIGKSPSQIRCALGRLKHKGLVTDQGDTRPKVYELREP